MAREGWWHAWLAGAAASALAALGSALLLDRLLRGVRLDWYLLTAQSQVGTATALGLWSVALALGALAVLAVVAVAGPWGRKDQQEPLGRPATWAGVVSVRLAVVLGAVLGLGLLVVAPRGTLPDSMVWALGTIMAALAAGVAAYLATDRLQALSATGDLVREHPRGRAVARLTVWSGKNATSVLLVVLVVTVGLGAGVTQIHTDVDVTDVLPRGHPDAQAAHNLTDEFKSAFTQQVSVMTRVNPEVCGQQSVDKLPYRTTEVQCGNITDEVYIRAIDELQRFFLERDRAPFKHSITAADFYKLINWTAEGGTDAPPGAFAIPGRSPQEEVRYRAVHEGLWEYVPDTVTAPMGTRGDIYANLFMVGAQDDVTRREVGDWAFQLREEYVQAVEDGETEWRVFGSDNPPAFVVDLPIADAHASELVQEDFQRLAPLILAFVLTTLYIGFRHPRGILVAGGMLVVSALWVFGALGWSGLGLNAFNLAVIPILLGSGIDYAIHLLTEIQAQKREGASDEQAFRAAGDRAGFALMIATLTTVGGLLLMMVSPSLLIAQLGLLSALAISSIFLLSLTFLPAAIVATGSSQALGRSFRASKLMPAVGRFVAGHRKTVAAALLLVILASLVTAQTLEPEPFGEPGLNFPEDDPVRQEYMAALSDFYDRDPDQAIIRSAVIVFEGDILDPASHHYMDALQEELRGRPHLDMSTSRHIPFLVRTWQTVEDGLPGAGAYTLEQELGPQLGQGEPYPESRQEVREIFEEAYASPLATFAGLFSNYPAGDMGIMTLSSEVGAFENVEGAWTEVKDAIRETEDQRPEGLKVSYAGNTATNYLFVTEQLPWLSYLGVATVLLVTALVAATTRDLRATLTVTALVVSTAIVWLGTLPLLGLGLAITLLLPAVFISALGSDYAVHMVWSQLKTGDPDRVYGVVGKAILFSALTDAGAFALFALAQDVPTQRTMVATVAAVLLTFALTTVIVALAYPAGRR